MSWNIYKSELSGLYMAKQDKAHDKYCWFSTNSNGTYDLTTKDHAEGYEYKQDLLNAIRLSEKLTFIESFENNTIKEPISLTYEEYLDLFGFETLYKAALNNIKDLERNRIFFKNRY